MSDAPASLEPSTELHASNHPDEKAYVKVALFLAVVTGAEVAVVYISSLENFLRPILGVMMVVKFAMVALWFMHLKFDSRIFRRLFILGIILALAVFAVVLATFTVVTRDPGVSG